MTWPAAFETWLTFWVGDTMGVYVFTPIIVVWTLLKPIFNFNEHRWEAFFIALALLLVTLLTFFINYPLLYFFIPLSVWAAYRFGMHGATVAIFFIALALIISTSLGYVEFSESIFVNPLIILVSFLEIIVATSLILAAVVNEREAASQRIKSNNVNLQQAVESVLHEIEEMNSEIYIQEKIASLGLLTTGIARQIQFPLKRINAFIKISIDCLNQFQKLCSPLVEKVEVELASNIQNNFKILENYLQHIAKLDGQANIIAKAIEEQSILTAHGRIQIKSVNINTLLNRCLNKATFEAAKRYPEFTFTAVEEFDKTVKMIMAVPEELALAFFHLINYAISSMKEKKDQLGAEYHPVLKIATTDYRNLIEIVIRDNGKGASDQQLMNFFSSFIETFPYRADGAPVEEATSISLMLAHDIITHIYQGQIEAVSKEGEYLQSRSPFLR